YVLSSSILTYKKDPYFLLYPWLGRGLLTSNGHQWMVKRKLITPSFHFRILKEFLQVMNETSGRFIDLLSREAAASKDQLLDIQNIVPRLTIDIICETAMGTKVNSVEGEPSDIVEAIAVLCQIITARVLSPLKRMDWFFRWTSMYWEQKQALTTLRRDLSKIIHNRRQLLETYSPTLNAPESEELPGKRPKMAFLDNLLTANVEGKPLSFEEIFEEVSTFMFEGHDTTAMGIIFSIFCLAWTPRAQKLAHEEQLNVFGEDWSRPPTYDELQQMPYLDLVIKETLRIFPSVPFIFRTVPADTYILDKFIPGGTSLVIPIYGIGHNYRNFEEPFEFRPERFSASNKTQGTIFDSVPFSAGPRNCIGQKFAVLELKVVLSKILRRFQLLPAPLSKQNISQVVNPEYKVKEQELKMAIAITLKSLTGVPVRLVER
ncbi:hypothetical protein KR018_007649, partial [Drosophila ironensis]